MAKKGGDQPNTAYGMFAESMWGQLQHERQYPDGSGPGLWSEGLFDKDIDESEFKKIVVPLMWANLEQRDRDVYQQLANRSNVQHAFDNSKMVFIPSFTILSKGEFCGVCKKSATDLASEAGPQVGPPQLQKKKKCSRCRKARAKGGRYSYCSNKCRDQDNKSPKAGPSLIQCARCKVARYCSKKCLDHDYHNGHEDDCKKVEEFLEMMKRGNIDIKRRMRYAEAMWEIAYKHESYIATKMVLDELLEILRLDHEDPFYASHMAVFMFLYLGT